MAVEVTFHHRDGVRFSTGLQNKFDGSVGFDSLQGHVRACGGLGSHRLGGS